MWNLADKIGPRTFADRHETAEEAQEETLKILALYKECAETELAMPVIDGQKTDSEKCAGAVSTYSIEALMRAIWLCS